MLGTITQEAGGSDFMIEVLRRNVLPLKAFGRAWQLLYEIYGGRAPPDIGKIREQIFIKMLEEEYLLKVLECQPTEREADVVIYFENGSEVTYSIKSSEVCVRENGLPSAVPVKVAWDNFPTDDKKSRFVFRYDILLLLGSKRHNKLFVVVLKKEDLNSMKTRLGYEQFFTKTKADKNPRGFGIKGSVVRKLIDEARKKGNFIGVEYPPISEDIKASFRSKYLRTMYDCIFGLAKAGLN